MQAHPGLGSEYGLGSWDEAEVNPLPLDAEWLEADGEGGFASGTVAGYRTRRYHALLLTPMTPPAGRVVLVNGLEAWVDTRPAARRCRPSITVPT